jgi:hypothetical protein
MRRYLFDRAVANRSGTRHAPDMGLSRRRAASVVLLGAAVSLGIVAVSSARFSWRREKDESMGADEPSEEPEAPEAQPEPDEEPRPRPRFKPAPPRDPDAPRWDTPPSTLETAMGPSP